ncbi:MAG: carbonic anhydrase family protein [Magnetococcales bacterium]|nr:carbonic anhydrase family protein [Magnetococcales bacterium]
MKRIQTIAVAALAVLALPFAAVAGSDSHGGSHHAAHWGYSGPTGPQHWGDLGYPTCSAGTQQSPIDINKVQAAALDPIQFNYHEAPINVVNNGHTIKFSYKPGSSISVGGKVFELLQFHIHAPSEHTVNGRSIPMELHLVHKAADGQLGVVGILMEVAEHAARGCHNPTLSKIFKAMPQLEGLKMTGSVTINANDLLPVNGEYINYSGSLTTPPCSEQVNWMVMRQPVGISQAQLDAFLAIYSGNNRPVQGLNERHPKLGGQ